MWPWDAELQGDHLDKDLGTGGGNPSCCRFTKYGNTSNSTVRRIRIKLGLRIHCSLGQLNSNCHLLSLYYISDLFFLLIAFMLPK